MAESQVLKRKLIPKRVFLNNIDSYSSSNIAEFLCKSMEMVSNNDQDDDDDEDEDEEEEKQKEREPLHPGQVFQVVGTVCAQSNEPRSYILEEYYHPDREQLLSKLMECHIVIYNISQDAEQVEEATWAVTALHNQIEHFSSLKLFILISTVMTWASTILRDPEDPERPLSDDFFYCRRPHPRFKQHIDLEKMVVKMGKSNRKVFPTYVVASGLQYGMGEHIFHYFFKESWLGKEAEISVFGDGKNFVPTIHIRDLARVLQNVIEHKPRPYYLLAVDSSHSSFEELVKAVSSVLGPGKIRKRPFADIYLIEDFSDMEIHSLQVNLRMDAETIRNLFSINWHCEFGLVENVELVVEEYRQARRLLPLRLCILGPPAVGKSTFSMQICKHYKLHHITLKDTISEAIARLDKAVKSLDPDAEDPAAEDEELLSHLKDNLENDDVSEEQIHLLKEKLLSTPCRNQGYVLDGFPSTSEQAEKLFGEDLNTFSSSTSILPEFLLCLDASDSFLTDRVINLPEEVVQELNYDSEQFLRRLSIYRKNNQEDKSVLNFFEELNVRHVHLEITSGEEPAISLLMQTIFSTVGFPRTYAPTCRELEEAEEKMRKEAEKRAEEEQREEEEARSRAANWEEWTHRSEQAKLEEERHLEGLTVQMRSYLMEHVMPTLSQGLAECYRANPPDPLDFLAEYLFRNNPFDHPK
ncbi:adenylate kinase 7 [Cyprinodon tularosa]|uniref:adenylate kinase 7 n=1 Tax=Cyprinodon tularosa TaxID=77115 RepID=UPI0018E2700A|nr:adenylate kinase 7 [Cyprinodon tularosa]